MPRPLSDQVVVITGASSGIGREAALRFGEQGASVVLAARDEEALGQVAAEINRHGGRADVVPTDVSEWRQVERLAREAFQRLGRIDTWVNCAAILEYATAEDTTVEEIERIVQVNLLGQIYGMKAVLPYLRQQRQGTIINVGSIESEVPIPYHSAYGATKHGIKGFTDVLRIELEREGLPIAVTLVEPSSVNTPIFVHARSKLGVLPYPMPPIYEPRDAAAAIVFAAEHPRRQIVVGGGGALFTFLERLSPPLVDRLMLLGGWGFTSQHSHRPDDGRDNFAAPMPATNRVRGPFPAMPFSLYTRLVELSPVAPGLLSAVALVAAGAFLWKARSA
jgi:short-subunit dehydrogenase